MSSSRDAGTGARRLEPGEHLGRYPIIELLGAGGMGEVYRAHDSELDREVAIKVLPEALAADPERLERLILRCLAKDPAARLASAAELAAALRVVDQMLAWLAVQNEDFIHGEDAYQAARIEAVLGEPDAAIDHLREAFANGLEMDLRIHHDPALEPLRDLPAFQELMRPR